MLTRVRDSYIQVLAFNKELLVLLYGFWLVRNAEMPLKSMHSIHWFRKVIHGFRPCFIWSAVKFL
jgi:hypothetical protein